MTDLEPRMLAVTAEVVARQPIPTLAVALFERGEIVCAFGMGATSTTRFPIASMTKTMTAAATLGRVDLGARLVDVLPHFTRHPAITVRHLLTHAAGLPDYHPLLGFDHEDDDGPIRACTLRANALDLLFEPGASHAYSNLGFDLLGDVLETIDGRSYPEIVEQTLLAPLGMTDTRIAEAAPRVRAMGHVTDVDGAIVASKPLYHPAHAPSGWTAASNVIDMVRWAMAHLRRDRHLPDVEALWHPQLDTARADRGKQCLGWIEYQHRGERVVAHGGWDLGYRCGMSILRERDAGVIVMNGFHWSATKGLCDAALDLLLGLEPTAPLMPIDHARALVGTYGPARVEAVGDDLFVDVGGRRSRLIPLDAHAHVAPFGAHLPGEPGFVTLRDGAIVIDGVRHRR